MATRELCRWRRTAISISRFIALMALAASAGGPLLANPSFGMIGLASGETLRLNVIASPANPCMAQLSFRNAAGVEVGPATSVSLAAGQGAPPLDFYPQDPIIPSGQRMEVRPVVNVISTCATASQCLATAEILDNATGNSLVEFAAGAPIASGVTPVYGLHGVAPGQILRLNVVAFPQNACHAQLGFRIFPNAGPTPSTLVSLSPGQAASLDLNPAAIGTLPGGQKLEVQPIITLQDSVSTCTATAEIFNATTARTLASATPPTSGTQPSFGMMGLAQNETLRLNVIAYPESPVTPAPPCMAQLGFFNTAGVQVGSTTTVTLNPGQRAAPLDFFPSSPIIPSGQRVEVRPVVNVISTSATVSQCLATAEVFDNTSGASLIEVAGMPPASPGVAPTYGIHGVASGQVLRKNVTAYPTGPVSPSPCRATLSFTNPETGQTIGPSPLSIALNPGQSTFLDFNPSALGIPAGQRIEVHPVITLQPSPVPSTCTVTVEVWDPSSGRTVAWTHKTTPALVCPGEPDFERGKNPDDSCEGK